MTGLVGLPGEARLAAVAAWEVPPVRGAIATLRAAAGRLPGWRARLGEVARTLEGAECWSGPAARSAAAAVHDLSTVAAAVDAALQRSLESLERLLREAGHAQERATEALALAGGPGAEAAVPDRVVPSMAGLFPELPVSATRPVLAAEAALAHAAAASDAADAAGVALAGLGVRDAFAPADFWDLAGSVGVMGPAAPPRVGGGGAPAEVALWWAGLSSGAQVAALRAAPGTIGGLDGVPAWARDRANRISLDRAVRHGTSTAASTARAVADRIAVEEAAGRRVQLHALGLEEEQVALVIGDLDTAAAVGLVVPGIMTSPDDLPRLLGDARDVAAAARHVRPGRDVAMVVWLGYASPDNPWEIGTRLAAEDGGPDLAAALEGLAAARVARGAPLPRTSVLAHSYGTVVTEEAAGAPGRLAADALVLLGSPGMRRSAADLEAPEVYDATAWGDPISWSGAFGMRTDAARFGSVGLPVDRFMGHSGYYDPDHPTQAAIGAVVAGVRIPG